MDTRIFMSGVVQTAQSPTRRSRSPTRRVALSELADAEAPEFETTEFSVLDAAPPPQPRVPHGGLDAPPASPPRGAHQKPMATLRDARAKLLPDGGADSARFELLEPVEKKGISTAVVAYSGLHKTAVIGLLEPGSLCLVSAAVVDVREVEPGLSALILDPASCRVVEPTVVASAPAARPPACGYSCAPFGGDWKRRCSCCLLACTGNPGGV